jgi:hypothetical protein
MGSVRGSAPRQISPRMKVCVRGSCQRAGQYLPLTEFRRIRISPDGGYRHEGACRECRRADWRRYHHRLDKPRRRARHSENRTVRLAKLADNLLDYLLCHPCVDCGEADPLVLEFDHRDPKLKVAHISKLVSNARSWKVVYEEIEKCDVRCANCHNRRHALEREYALVKALKRRNPNAETHDPA